jgi:hypothetical protein
MRNDFIIDFETMGKNSQNCSVIDCSVMVFSWDKFISNEPYTLDNIKDAKRFKLSVADQVKNYGWVVEDETINFWQEQPKEVRDRIMPKKDDLSVDAFVDAMHKYLINSPKISYWWSRSNTFDPIVLNRLFVSQNKLLQMESVLKFWKIRDTRTYIDAKLDFPAENSFIPIKDVDLWNKSFKKHDSSWDILADVLRIQAIVRAENDLEQV